MALINGIGDELLTIFVVIITIIIVILSWLSTNVRDFPFPANLLIIERRSRRLYATNNLNETLNSTNQSQNQSNNSNNSTNITNENSSLSVDNSSNNNETQTNSIRDNNLELMNEMVEQALVENLLDGNFYSGHNINLIPSNVPFQQNLVASSVGINSGNGQATSSMISNSNYCSNEVNSENSCISNENEGLINVLIKFVNEKEMKIQVKPSDTILLIKKAHFGQELSNNKIVRFIYQGQFLADKNTVKSYNIKDQTTIHCHITSKSTPTTNLNQDNEQNNELRHRDVTEQATNETLSSSQNEINRENNENTNNQQIFPGVINNDLNHVLLPLLAIFLGTCWYLRIHFKHLFSPLSTLILIIFTFLYGLFLFNNLQSASPPASNIDVNNILVHRRVLHIREEPPQPSQSTVQ
ncbi:unnamed protein product [Brachionus calyciflorus]|uniref:Ubiquitin-like domain-containing protein n=1 Tax=Brachionus calyciflorus TaxID=104777 RepID=A0A813PUE1_9BILA|nr:unnamed protein product [Brachionus calyciflorus]